MSRTAEAFSFAVLLHPVVHVEEHRAEEGEHSTVYRNELRSFPRPASDSGYHHLNPAEHDQDVILGVAAAEIEEKRGSERHEEPNRPREGLSKERAFDTWGRANLGGGDYKWRCACQAPED